MKDSVVRGRLLQLLYERRDEGSIPFGHVEQAVPPPGGIGRRDWLRAVAQLSDTASSTGLLLKIKAEWASCRALRK